MKDIFRQRREAAEAAKYKTRVAALGEAVEALRGSEPGPDDYIGAAKCHEELGDHKTAVETLQRGIERCLPSARLYRRYTRLMHMLNRTEEAIEGARQGRLHFPSDFFFRLQEALLLPVLYSDSTEIERYRERFTEKLREVSVELRLDSSEARESALAGLNRHHNFLLAYQGKDDRDLQAIYGNMTHRIMAASYPEWVRPVQMPPDDGCLRIGYVSSHLHRHSVSKTHLGWLLEHNRERFQTFTYYIGARTDEWTWDARRASTSFWHLPDDLEGASRAILAARLHVLVFLDIGMNPQMNQLAALRLAPVQCTTWGHPVTSGLPTVDYFLSSELMEPADAPRFYTEKLVCFPGIGICYSRPFIPGAAFYKTRSDYGIRDDAVAYLCCQSSFKYLPQHDDVFPRIARLVPGAQFVFIARNDFLREDLRKRLEKSFSATGVQIADHVVFVPYLDGFDYQSLNSVADIYLDSLGWSGCNSTMEAIACRLPVVTLPGEFMRGRHSHAILTQLGVIETIARDKADYVDIAVRLALDQKWRNQIVRDMVDGYPRIFSDKRSVWDLEEFYADTVRCRLLAIA